MFHIKGHKTSLNKFKDIEVISGISSDHNGRKPEISHRKKREEKTITWRLNNMLLKKQWVNDEVKEDILKYLETKNNENTTIQNLWDAAKAVLDGSS